MSYSHIIVGLGNPGEEYENSRHSTGRRLLLALAKSSGDKIDFTDWQFDKKLNAQTAKGKIGKKEIFLVLPETFMNKSGLAVKPLITSVKKAATLVVVYDDVDLPLGALKICFNRGSGGHKGLESIVKAIKTGAFIRFRLGVSPTTPSGKIKKPTGEKVVDFIISDFKPAEKEKLQKVIKTGKDALRVLVADGLAKAMNEFN